MESVKIKFGKQRTRSRLIIYKMLVRRLNRIHVHPPTHKIEVFFFLSVSWRPAKLASVRPEQISGKCSSGYHDVNTSGYKGPGGMS